MMAFTGNEEHDITLATAAKLTKAYRDSVPASSNLGGYISKSAIESIIDQTGCVGIRYYHGLTTGDKPEIVFVGVKANEDDIDGGEIMERSIKCPPHCGDDNDLNSD